MSDDVDLVGILEGTVYMLETYVNERIDATGFYGDGGVFFLYHFLVGTVKEYQEEVKDDGNTYRDRIKP